MSTRIKRPVITSPFGVAIYPRLNEPDTKFKPEGEYSVGLAFDGDDEAALALIKKLEAERDEQFAKFISENPKKKKTATVASVYTDEMDDEGEETGRIILKFKMRASGVKKETQKAWTMRPSIFDSLKQEITKNAPNIGGGSILRANFETSTSFIESAKAFYLTLRLNGVQIKELKSFGGRSADSMGFDEVEDGFDGNEGKAEGSSADSIEDDKDFS